MRPFLEGWARHSWRFFRVLLVPLVAYIIAVLFNPREILLEWWHDWLLQRMSQEGPGLLKPLWQYLAEHPIILLWIPIPLIVLLLLVVAFVTTRQKAPVWNARESSEARSKQSASPFEQVPTKSTEHTIRDWLYERGFFAGSYPVPDADFRMIVHDNQGHEISISQPKTYGNVVVIETTLSVEEDDQPVLDAVTARNDILLNDLRMEMIRLGGITYSGIEYPLRRIGFKHEVSFDARLRETDFIEHLGVVRRAITIVEGLIVRAMPPSSTGVVEPQSPPAQLKSISTVVIRIPSRPNQAVEPDIEWVHLEAEAEGSTARDALVWMHIGDQRYDLRWPSDEGPQETRNLHVGRPVPIPVVARYSSEDQTASRGLWRGTLRSNVCHVTDAQFLIHRANSAILAPNQEYRLDVTVQYNDGERAKESFWLFVAKPGTGPITLRKA